MTNIFFHIFLFLLQLGSLEWRDPILSVHEKFLQIIRQTTRNLFYTQGHTHMARMGKWPWRCTSTGQDSSNELDLEWIFPVVAEFQCPQDSQSPYYTHRHTHMAPHGQMTITLHIYRPRQFKCTWFGVNRPSGCQVPASARFPESLLHPQAHPYGSQGQMTMTMQIYRQRQFKWTWFRVDWSSSCGVTASIKWGTDGRTDRRTDGQKDGRMLTSS